MAKFDAKFREWAPRMMMHLMEAFPSWGPLDAAACAGNGGHESGGFRLMQELKPVVHGSRGGLGGFQWTGPRRRKYEAWCLNKGLNPHSEEATIGFLIHELKGPEKATVGKVAKAKTLDAKVVAFELAFERAGVKHYPSRKKWAAIAFAEFIAKRGPTDVKWDPTAKDFKVGPALPALEERPITLITPPAPIPADIDKETVAKAQQVLAKLGYYHTKIDGQLGPLTLAAISQFQKLNSIQVTGQLDNGTLEKLADPDAVPSEMVPERANATPQTVREILPEAKQTWRAKIAAKFSALGAGLWAMVTGVGTYFEDAKSYIEPVQDYVSNVPAWTWLVAIAGISGGIWYATRSAEQGQVEAYKEGARQ